MNSFANKAVTKYVAAKEFHGLHYVSIVWNVNAEGAEYTELRCGAGDTGEKAAKNCVKIMLTQADYEPQDAHPLLRNR